MGRKPMQFQVREKMRAEIEQWVDEKETTLSEMLRQSVRMYMILSKYIDNGYRVILRKDDEGVEKEIIIS